MLKRKRRRVMPVLNYLQITLSFLTSVFLEEANFTNSLHLTLQPPVICSFDKTGLQTSVIADCLHLLTLSTWTPTEPILNHCVKNKSSYFPLLFFLIVLFSFCLIVLLIFPTHLTRNFCISHAWLLISLSCLWLFFFTDFVASLLFLSLLSRVCVHTKPVVRLSKQKLDFSPQTYFVLLGPSFDSKVQGSSCQRWIQELCSNHFLF